MPRSKRKKVRSGPAPKGPDVPVPPEVERHEHKPQDLPSNDRGESGPLGLSVNRIRVDLTTALQAYDFLDGQSSDKIPLIVEHAPRDEVVVAKDTRGVVLGVLVFRQISDPYDVKISGLPEVAPIDGRYVYVVRAEVKSYTDSHEVVNSLVECALRKSPMATRVAFRYCEAFAGVPGFEMQDEGSEEIYVREYDGKD